MPKIILTQDVDNLGQAGDVVDVKPGYARNYLLPRGYATRWTRGAQKQIDQASAARQRREIVGSDDARALRDRLQAAAGITIAKRTSGETERLFGSVSATDIAQAVQDQLGEALDRRAIQIDEPIRTLGAHTVQVRLHPQVTAELKVAVTAAAE